jgi:tetratricopeptide (TPR) repeat protein
MRITRLKFVTPILAALFSSLAIIRAADDIKLVPGASGDERLRIEARINGQPVGLVLDTGTALRFVLFEDALPLLGLKNPYPGLVPASSGPGTSAPIVGPACAWSLLGTNFNALSAILADVPLFPGEDYAGLVGWSAMRDNIWVFDLARGKVATVKEVPAEARNWQRFQIRTFRNQLLLRSETVSGPGICIAIDTGAPHGLELPPALWQAWKAKHPDAEMTVTANQVIGQKGFFSEVAWADKIQIGPVELRGLSINETDEAYLNEAPAETIFAIGLEGLKRMELVVDGPHQVAFLHPSTAPASEPEHNRLGAIFLKLDGESDNLTARVAERSSAARAGLRDGDVLSKIDGKDIASLSRQPLFNMEDFWRKPAGTTYRLEVKRGDAMVSLSVRLEDVLRPASGGIPASSTSPLQYVECPFILRSNDDDVALARGIEKMGKGEKDTAIACFNQAILFTPDFAMAYDYRGAAKEAKGDVAGAIADYGQAIALDPHYADAFGNRGRAKSNLGDMTGAMSDYDRAIALDPKYAEAYANRGDAQYYLGNYDMAIAEYDQAIALKSDLAEGYRNRAMAKRKKGDLAGALTDCTAALALNPWDETAYLTRVDIDWDQNNWDAVMTDCNHVLALNVKSVEVYVKRGTARMVQGDPRDALADFDAAIALDAKNFGAHKNRALAEMNLNDYPKAIADCDFCLSLDTKDPGVYSNRAGAEYEQGDDVEAILDLDKAIALDPKNHADFYSNRGMAEQRHGDFKKAKDDFARSIALNPQALSNYDFRAVASLAEGDFDDAIADFRLVAQNAGSSVDYGLFARYLLSLTLRRLQRKDDTNLPLAVAKIPSGWAKDAGLFLIGKLSESALISQAEKADANAAVGEECQAFYYAAMVRLVNGDSAGARALLAKCVGTKARDQDEFILAQAELPRLDHPTH